MIESIGSVSAVTGALTAMPSSSIDATANSAGVDFAATLESALTQANDNVNQAETAVQQLASGQPIELHDVMITLEKARISVQTIIQIRNRVLDVYQDLTRMQI